MSVVYFIQAGADGPIKIGFTADLPRRILSLQPGCPEPLVVLATIGAGRRYEKRLHWALAPYRYRGEWFHPTSEVLAAVDAAKAGHEFEPKAIECSVEITGASALLDDIERFCAATGIPESTFGLRAMGDWKFVRDLRASRHGKPRRVWPETEARARRFMAAYRLPESAAA